MSYQLTPKTIVVAMSGGVDSSVVAAILHEQGHKVVGITLQLYDHGSTLKKKGACCAGQDIYDAKAVADSLGFPHYILDYESQFKESVIDNFIDSYLEGQTPLPCVKCNQSVKFNDLLKAAQELGADALATGHYVRKVKNDQGFIELHKGEDAGKDQSYFLFATTYEQLEYLMFPLGSFNKEETRKLAKKYGLAKIAVKPDSQDICFVPNGNYREVINKLRPDANKTGKFIHIDGYELGQHQGIINYTVGQRRGLGLGELGFDKPLYVVRIDPITGNIYVGPETALLKTSFVVKDANWLTREVPQKISATAKIRSSSPGVSADINNLNNGNILVNLYNSERAITPGQACVFYEGTRMLGGGWIEREIR